MDSDDSDFYVGEHSIINQNEQITEIGLNEIDNQEVEVSKANEPSQIPQNCALGPTQLEYKILKISGQRQNNPTFHFQINKKLYIYSIHGIRSDNKIILICRKQYEVNKVRSTCGNFSYISASELLQKIIKNTLDRSETSSIGTSIYLGCMDSRVYDMENYDMNSFEMGIGRVRTWEILI
jgi:hypothetical protein